MQAKTCILNRFTSKNASLQPAPCAANTSTGVGDWGKRWCRFVRRAHCRCRQNASPRPWRCAGARLAPVRAPYSATGPPCRDKSIATLCGHQCHHDTFRNKWALDQCLLMQALQAVEDVITQYPGVSRLIKSNGPAVCAQSTNFAAPSARRSQRQSRMLAQRVEVDLGKALLRQAHVVGAGAQIRQRACRVE